MRVLIFSTVYFPLIGGAEVAMREVTDRISDGSTEPALSRSPEPAEGEAEGLTTGVEFHMVCSRLKPGLASNEKIGNITVHRVGFGRTFDKYLLPVLGTLKALTLGRFDAIWSLMASYGGFTALAYTWIKPHTKLLLTLQEGDPLEHYAKRAGKLEFLHRKVFERADAVQAISRFLAEWSVKMGFRGTPDVVPNGVDIVRFTSRITDDERGELRTCYGFAETDVVLVTASRLSLKNGIDDLIRSFVKLPASYKLLIAGDGEDRQKLEVLTEQKGLVSRVVFLGSKSHHELPGILQASDIFVRASLSEGLGNSFLEAMAAGIPVIGTPVGGIPDFLTDGETGVFCQPRDPDSIVTAVLRIQNDPALRSRLIANGERLVREKYGWDGIALRIRGMLTSLSSKNA
ncbi:MAG TPA: glycosyltransferase family 4 protein [Candidatus Methylomirabilis sp.]|nr:glycosyltransferase family 4 protein [Candidatus Methylomirabilis sp.]